MADEEFDQLTPPEQSFVEDDVPHDSQRLAKGTASILVGRLLNFGLQAVYFIVLARLFHDAQEYGLFSGVFALVVTVAPFSAAGSSMLYMRYVSSDTKSASVYWGNSLLITCVFTLVACMLALIAGMCGHLLAHPYMTAILLLANCLFSQITALAGMLFFSLDRLRMSAILTSVSNAARCIAVIVLKLFYTKVSASYWAVALTFASLAAACYSLWKVYEAIGVPSVDLTLLKRRFLEGLGFSFAGSTDAANNDIDKVMLAHFNLTFENGFYTLAYRIIDFATVPIGSICASVTQRQFQLAHRGIGPVMTLARKSLAVSFLLGLVTVFPIIGLARFIPMLVGPSYIGVVRVLSWLCWLPLIRSIHQLAGATVTGLGYQGLRTGSQAAAVVLNLILNFIWIPMFGWKGAAVAALLCDGFLAACNLSILLYLNRKLTRQEAYTPIIKDHA